MAQGCGDDASYRAYLRGMHAFVTSLRPAVEAQARTIGWTLPEWQESLEHDLAALDLPALAAEAPSMPGARASVLGRLYVIEGSSLGARVLLRQAHSLGHRAGNGACFLHAHADGEGGARWPRFLDLLESEGTDPAVEKPACDAAVDTFLLAERCFRRAQGSQR